jgi:hypothetical protein
MLITVLLLVATCLIVQVCRLSDMDWALVVSLLASCHGVNTAFVRTTGGVVSVVFTVVCASEGREDLCHVHMHFLAYAGLLGVAVDPPGVWLSPPPCL